MPVYPSGQQVIEATQAADLAIDRIGRLLFHLNHSRAEFEARLGAAKVAEAEAAFTAGLEELSYARERLTSLSDGN